MKKFCGCLLGLALAATLASVATAQEKAGLWGRRKC